MKRNKVMTLESQMLKSFFETIGLVVEVRNYDDDPAPGKNFRKLVLAMSEDIRVLLVKLADRLHNMQTLRFLKDPEKRRRIARETMDIYVPLAERIGMHRMKDQLEDLAFAELHPDARASITARLGFLRESGGDIVSRIVKELTDTLSEGRLAATASGREKSPYSIWRKMQRKNVSFEQLADVMAFRVLVDDTSGCYHALGIIHSAYPVVPGRFKDFISTPKPNNYRSLHTGVIGPERQRIEVQIRTREMHEIAELGVAAHWTYKEGGPRDAQYQRKIEWVRRLLEPAGGGRADADRDLIEGMRTELFEDRVYVLTPKGEVVDLPHGATPLDFAYSVHTSLGHRCRGAKTNGRIVPLTHQLTNGEIVEIITGKHDAPSRDWLAPEQGYLVSPRNRSKVRAWFRKLDVADNRSAGRQIAERELSRLGVRPEHMSALVSELKANDIDHMHQLLGEGEITVTQLVQAAGEPCASAIIEEELPEPGPVEKSSSFGTMAEITYAADTMFLTEFPGGWKVMAAGCAPVPGHPYDCQLQGG